MSGESLRVMIRRVASTRHRGLERRQVLEVLPAVVEADPRHRLVAARRIRLRAATAPALGIDRDLGIGGAVEINRRRAASETARRRSGVVGEEGRCAGGRLRAVEERAMASI